MRVACGAAVSTFQGRLVGHEKRWCPRYKRSRSAKEFTMIRLLWLSLAFGLVVALLFGVCARPNWAASLGLGGSNVRHAEKDLQEALQCQNELDQRRERVLERSESLHAVIAALIA